MEHFGNASTPESELALYNASRLRCNGQKFTTCGNCEVCQLGHQLNYTKEWFLRCSEETQRQFILGLVHRYNSTDLHEYTNALLRPLEGKDFIYAMSRNRPSLKEDLFGPVANHALSKTKLTKDIFACLNWFESSPHWTKCNFMLGLMQSCNSRLLHFLLNECQSYCFAQEDRCLSLEDTKITGQLGNLLFFSVQTCIIYFFAGIVVYVAV